jgi:hypothetical protein
MNEERKCKCKVWPLRTLIIVIPDKLWRCPRCGGIVTNKDADDE